MSTTKFKGRVLNYDIYTNELIVKLDNLDPSLQANVEYITENFSKYLQMQIDYNIKESIRDQLRKKWYASLQTLLIKNDIAPNSEAMQEIDKEMRESIFPVKDSEILEPKRMREMTNNELQDAISILLDRHPEANI